MIRLFLLKKRIKLEYESPVIFKWARGGEVHIGMAGK